MGPNIPQSGFRNLVICALLIGSSFANNDENNSDRPNENETRSVRVQITPPGTPEELRPNLVGLANMAIFYLPQSLNFDHVEKATREIVDGVRYELIVSSKDSEKNEVICAIGILEKPWITTEWGDKLRILKYSNCSVDENERIPFNPDKYEGNTIFNRDNTVLTHGDLSDLEAQILAGNKKKINLPPEQAAKEETVHTTDTKIATGVLKGIESQIVPMGKVPTGVSSTTTRPVAESDGNVVDEPTRTTTDANANRCDFSVGSLAFLDSIFLIDSPSTERTEQVPCGNRPSQILPDVERTSEKALPNTAATDPTVPLSTSTESTKANENVGGGHISDDSKAFLETIMSSGINVEPARPNTPDNVEAEHKTVQMPLPDNRPVESDVQLKEPVDEKSTSPEDKVARPEISDDSKALLETIFGGIQLEPKTPQAVQPELKTVQPNPPNRPVQTDCQPVEEKSKTPEDKLPHTEISSDSKALLESMFMSSITTPTSARPNTPEIVEPEHNVMGTPPTDIQTADNGDVQIKQIENQSVDTKGESQPNGSSSTATNTNETVQRRKRQNPNFVKDLAQEAVRQLNDNYNRTSTLLEVLDYNHTTVSNEEDYYLMSVRLLDKMNGSEKCSMINNSQKLCSFEVVVNNKNAILAQSQCLNENAAVLIGGPKRIPEKELPEIEAMVSESLLSLKNNQGQDGSAYEKVVKVYCASRQVVAGTLYKISAQFQDKNNENIDCVMEIWSRPWIKVDGTEITLKCDGKSDAKYRYRRSANTCLLPLLKRASRSAAVPLIDRKEYAHIEELINDTVPLAEADLYKKINKIHCATELYINDVKYYQLYAELQLNDDEVDNCQLTLIEASSRKNVITRQCGRYPMEYRYEYYPSILSIPHNKKTKEQKLFAKFLRKYNRLYGHTSEEFDRYGIFVKNLQRIKLLNEMEEGTAKYGLTEFADLTAEEYSKRTGLLYNQLDSNSIRNPVAEIPDFKLPKAFDWREKGAITKVKNQGSCGSCWAFSVTGNIEGLHAIKSGKLEEYSEQELVDCDTVDKGCGGGLPDNAYKAIEQIGGLELEDEYPYKARQSSCSFNKTLSHVQVKGAVDLPKNETAMALWLLANGPISIGINANGMQFYRGGISHPWRPLCRHSSLDHGVLIVGFGIAEYPVFNKTLPFWIVKNSWGESWGERGYYRVFRGDNTCGISEMASSAVLSD